MDYKKHEGRTINSRKGVFSVFKIARRTKDHLHLLGGKNKENNKEITVIPFDKDDETTYRDRISFFYANKEELRFLDEHTSRDKTTYVIFELAPPDFEKIYLRLLLAEDEFNIPSAPKPLTAKETQSHPKHSANRIILSVVFLLLTIGVSSVYLSNLAAPIPEITSTNIILTDTMIIPSNTVEASSTPPPTFLPTDTLIPQITDTPAEESSTTPEFTPTGSSTPTNIPDITSTLTLKPSNTPTITPIPTRTAMSNELNLCAIYAEGAKIRSLPSIASDKIGILGFGQCLWFNAKKEINKNEIWVQVSPDQGLMDSIGGWIRSDLLTDIDLSILDPITLEPKPGITSTPTVTPTITLTP